MSDALYGRGLYVFTGLSTDSASPTSDSTASTWATVPLPGQRAIETDTLDVYEFDSLTWLKIKTGTADGSSAGLMVIGGVADGVSIGGASEPAVTVPADPDTNDDSGKIAYSTATTTAITAITTNGLAIGDSIRCFASTDCYIRFDDQATAATSGSMYFAAGTEILKIPVGATHMSVIQVTTGGNLFITKLA